MCMQIGLISTKFSPIVPNFRFCTSLQSAFGCERCNRITEHVLNLRNLIPICDAITRFLKEDHTGDLDGKYPNSADYVQYINHYTFCYIHNK